MDDFAIIPKAAVAVAARAIYAGRTFSRALPRSFKFLMGPMKPALVWSKARRVILTTFAISKRNWPHRSPAFRPGLATARKANGGVCLPSIPEWQALRAPKTRVP